MTTPEISKAEASEYQHAVLVDKSGSMATASKRMAGKNRWEEAQEHISSLCHFLSDVDEDGLDIILFGSAATVYRGIKSPDEIAKIFAEATPRGTTNLAAALQEAEKLRSSKGGRWFFHVLTDGVPDSEQATAEAIAASVKTMKEDRDLAISFLQIGDDPDATKFLKKLDDDLQKSMKLPFDAVNTMTVTEADGLSYEQVMHAALHD